MGSCHPLALIRHSAACLEAIQQTLMFYHHHDVQYNLLSYIAFIRLQKRTENVSVSETTTEDNDLACLLYRKQFFKLTSISLSGTLY